MSIIPTTKPKAGTATAPASGSTAQVQQVIPFSRGSRKKSRLIGQFGPIVMGVGVQPLAPIQVPAAGFLRRIILTVTGTTAGNAAGVAFANDGVFYALQQVSLLSPNGDTIINIVDGFTLYALIKYGAFATGRYDPVADPTYSTVAGVGGGLGGSFKFNIRIPVELDSRDAFCALKNMAANQSFLLQLAVSSLAQLFTTAPTAAPSISITAVMEYWNKPADTNADGVPQAQEPIGVGSVSLVQTQTPAIVPGSQQNIQMLNVGNTIRFLLFILRTAGGVRTSTDWPNVTNFYVNGDPWYYKTKDQWLSQLAQEYDYTAGVTATPTLNSLDQGVYVLTDFMNDGASGDGNVDGGSNRNLFLATDSGTAFNVEAVNWGAAAAQLLIVTNAIRPSSPAAMFAPQWI
jgi:hypothetical protein